MLSCGCRCALVLIEEQLHVFQYHSCSIIYLIRYWYIFSFSCSCTIHITLGSQYLQYVDPGKVLLVWYSFVFTGFGVDVATPLKFKHGLFAPVFASIIVVVIVIRYNFGIFRFGNDSYRHRYRYRHRNYFGLIVPKRF